jgi:hypothetical protein
MSFSKGRHDLAKEMNFAHADTVKPDARLIAVAQQRLPDKFAPETATIFACSQSFVD